MNVYKVGGAVRDALMGLEPKDNDWVVVGATKEDVAKMLEEGYTQVGASFPVFLHPTTGDEYAFARVERKVGVGYHGFEVSTEGVTIEADLARRDLTINSMAQADDGTIIDPYGGMEDLKNKILRHTTEAFAEDPLRVLRLARFAARWDWEVHPSTIELCKTITRKGELNHLSIERIWVEIEKGLQGKSPAKFFRILEQVEAIENCDLLYDMFPRGLPVFTEDVSHSIAKLAMEDRFTIGVAVLAYPDARLKGAPSRVRDAQSAILMTAVMYWTAKDIMKLLTKTRALKDGQAFKDLVAAYQCLANARMHLFRPDALIKARDAAKLVTADMFPGVTGKELGNAINDRRIEMINLALVIQSDKEFYLAYIKG